MDFDFEFEFDFDFDPNFGSIQLETVLYSFDFFNQLKINKNKTGKLITLHARGPNPFFFSKSIEIFFYLFIKLIYLIVLCCLSRFPVML